MTAFSRALGSLRLEQRYCGSLYHNPPLALILVTAEVQNSLWAQTIPPQTDTLCCSHFQPQSPLPAWEAAHGPANAAWNGEESRTARAALRQGMRGRSRIRQRVKMGCGRDATRPPPMTSPEAGKTLQSLPKVRPKAGLEYLLADQSVDTGCSGKRLWPWTWQVDSVQAIPKEGCQLATCPAAEEINPSAFKGWGEGSGSLHLSFTTLQPSHSCPSTSHSLSPWP